MAKDKSILAAPPKVVDAALDSLFASSVGPVKAPSKSRYVDLLPQKIRESPKQSKEDEDYEDNDEELSEASEEFEDVSDEDEESDNESSNNEDDDEEDDEEEDDEEPKTVASNTMPDDDGRKRKRKQRDDDEDLEAKYFERLAQEDDAPTGKRRKDSEGRAAPVETDIIEEDTEMKDAEGDSGDEIPVHESLAVDATVSEIEKANRTVFLSNVSSEAVTSRTAKKALLKHLGSILDPKADPPQKVESIRFRSTAFSSAALPKRAAYIKKEVMEATTKSTNAYVVYSTPLAVRLAVEKLNSTVILDRHLRVDSVAHPSPVDHKRCVFVGNLGFVDDETVFNVKTDEDGNEVTEKKKRTKQPMDIEEGLWRVFGKEAGKVESVRVPRDSVTRVGKGFAYVQFYDANDVEKAILLNEKKFPPMLPRTLRVTRCKAPHKTARAMEAKAARQAAERKASNKKSGKSAYVPKITAEAQTLAGRAGKLLGRAGAAQLTGKGKKGSKRDRPLSKSKVLEKRVIKPPEDFIFEGRRASEKDGKPKDLKFKGARSSKDKKGYKKPGGRGAARAAKWKAGGADKKKAAK